MVEVGEVVAVLDAEPPVERGRQPVEAAQLEEHRRPHVLDGEEARLLLAVRAHDPVRRVVPVGVEGAVPVRAHDALVGQTQRNAPTARGLWSIRLQKSREPRAVAAVVEAVQKLGGHDELRPVQYFPAQQSKRGSGRC